MKILGSQNTATVLSDYLGKCGVHLTSEGLSKLTDILCDRLTTENGLVSFSNDRGEKTELFNHVARMHESAEHRSYFEASGPLFSDLVNNPWKKGPTFNLTRQWSLEKKFPEHANRIRELVEPSNDSDDAANPFSKTHFNLTKQMQLMKSDPVKAEALRQQAEGVQ